MKKCCNNCAYIEFTADDGIKCNLKGIDYLDEEIDIENECCYKYEYNKCLDCNHDECLYEKCDIWD